MEPSLTPHVVRLSAVGAHGPRLVCGSRRFLPGPQAGHESGANLRREGEDLADWVAVGAVAAGIGSLATGASMTLIAWQAWETRRTANAAIHGLDVARDSLTVSQRLAAEAVRTRLDTRAPQLRVVAANTSAERARRPTTAQRGQLGPEWPIGQEFSRSEHELQDLVLGCEFSVVNDGKVAAEIWLDGPITLLHPAAPPARIEAGTIKVRLAPTEASRFRLDDRRPLSDWADAWDGRARGDRSPNIRGEVTCNDSFDEGIVDRWTIEGYCYPVEPTQRDGAAWVLRSPGSDPPIVSAHASRVQRKYYISKERGVPLGNAF